MKKLIFFLFIITSFILTGNASAQMGSEMMREADDSSMVQGEPGHSQGLDEVIQGIIVSQDIQSKEEVDCSRITDDQFENVGDAWMSVMVPNENAHERMDRMMGGEGSESLKQAHIQMGKNYLECSENTWGMGIMPMMLGMNSYIRGGETNMMGFGDYGGLMGGFGLVFVIFWIVILIDLILLGIWLWKQIQKK